MSPFMRPSRFMTAWPNTTPWGQMKDQSIDNCLGCNTCSLPSRTTQKSFQIRCPDWQDLPKPLHPNYSPQPVSYCTWTLLLSNVTLPLLCYRHNLNYQQALSVKFCSGVLAKNHCLNNLQFIWKIYNMSFSTVSGH